MQVNASSTTQISKSVFLQVSGPLAIYVDCAFLFSVVKKNPKQTKQQPLLSNTIYKSSKTFYHAITENTCTHTHLFVVLLPGLGIVNLPCWCWIWLISWITLKIVRIKLLGFVSCVDHFINHEIKFSVTIPNNIAQIWHCEPMWYKLLQIWTICKRHQRNKETFKTFSMFSKFRKCTSLTVQSTT